MNQVSLSFTAWLAGRQAVSFALGIGVIFLITQYQSILHITNPENTDFFRYPYALRVLLSHLDSLFFGFSTAIFIFQSKSEVQKIMYCIFEAIMICLNLNRVYLGEESKFYLSCYIAVFSGFTLYFLGTLAKQHSHYDKKISHLGNNYDTNNRLPITDAFGEPYTPIVTAQDHTASPIGFEFPNHIPKQGKKGRPPLSTDKIKEVEQYLNEGYSLRQTAKACNISLQKVTEIKNNLK
jgi:hypothetical protein